MRVAVVVVVGASLALWLLRGIGSAAASTATTQPTVALDASAAPPPVDGTELPQLRTATTRTWVRPRRRSCATRSAAWR